MAGFGSALGAFGSTYPQFQQQQQQQQMNQMKLQQAVRQMALEDQQRKAQAQALDAFGKTQGSGPGGTITPQQMAAVSGGSPEAFSMINSAVRPANTGIYGLEGRNISGQYGLDRTGLRNEGNVDVANIRGQSAENVAGIRNEGLTDTQKLRNEGSAATQKIRNERPFASSGARAAASITNSPEYKTAKSEFEEAKKDERNIIAHYPVLSQAYNDPQWLDARKRAVAAQTKMEAIQTKATKDEAQGTAAVSPVAPSASPVAPQIPPEAISQLKEGAVTTFGNGQKWTLKNGQPAQVE